MPSNLASHIAAVRLYPTVYRTTVLSLSAFSLFTAVALANISISNASAEDGLGGLSQLDFDRPSTRRPDAVVNALSAEPELTPEQIRALINEPEAIVVAPAVPDTTEPDTAVPNTVPAKPALKPAFAAQEGLPVAPEAARAQLGQPRPEAAAEAVQAVSSQGGASQERWSGPVTKFEWTRSGDSSSHYLPPRLKGPDVDKAAPNSITTDASWAKHDGGCQEPKDLRSACAKSTALKELFSRFSGSDDVFSSQCAGFSCPDPTHEPRLTGFAIAPKRGGEFRMLAVGNSCHYQLEAPKGPGSWVMLEGVRGSCSCVPKSCG